MSRIYLVLFGIALVLAVSIFAFRSSFQGYLSGVLAAHQSINSSGTADSVINSSGAVYCTEIYAPVCGIDGKTYSNSCVATQQAKTVIDCKGTCPCKTVAYFRFSQRADSRNSFVIKLTDAAKIAQARQIIAKKDKTQMITGVIAKKAVSYNAPWSYMLVPNSITFAQMATEVCDATIQYVQTNLAAVGGALLPGNRWCPWTSYLISEIKF